MIKCWDLDLCLKLICTCFRCWKCDFKCPLKGDFYTHFKSQHGSQYSIHTKYSTTIENSQGKNAHHVWPLHFLFCLLSKPKSIIDMPGWQIEVTNHVSVEGLLELTLRPSWALNLASCFASGTRYTRLLT